MKEEKVPYEYRQRKKKENINNRKLKIGNIDVSQCYCPITITSLKTLPK